MGLELSKSHVKSEKGTAGSTMAAGKRAQSVAVVRRVLGSADDYDVTDNRRMNDSQDCLLHSGVKDFRSGLVSVSLHIQKIIRLLHYKQVHNK